MTRILVATSNSGKLAELRAALADVGLEVVGLDALPQGPEVEETGATFEENARLKAEAYSLRTDLPVLADDSGIEVDALGGAPGVQSARYGGPDLDDPGRNRLLLERLRGVPTARRTARFRCVLACAAGGRTIAVFHGVVEGRIADSPSGPNGFGYDPIFYYCPIGKTFGEIGREEKQEFSHRGEAIGRFLAAVRSGALSLDPASRTGPFSA